MAGRHGKSLEKQITSLQERIRLAEEKRDENLLKENQKIENLVNQLQELNGRKKAEEVEKLYSLLETKGLSVSDIETMIGA